MFVDRKARYSALVTNLVRWHPSAVSLPLRDVILAQPSCLLSNVMFCIHSEITNLSLYKHCTEATICIVTNRSMIQFQFENSYIFHCCRRQQRQCILHDRKCYFKFLSLNKIKSKLVNFYNRLVSQFSIFVTLNKDSIRIFLYFQLLLRAKMSSSTLWSQV